MALNLNCMQAKLKVSRFEMLLHSPGLFHFLIAGLSSHVLIRMPLSLHRAREGLQYLSYSYWLIKNLCMHPFKNLIHCSIII